MEKIKSKIIIDEGKYEELRKELHKIPELGFELPKTFELLKNTIKSIKNYEQNKNS